MKRPTLKSPLVLIMLIFWPAMPSPRSRPRPGATNSHRCRLFCPMIFASLCKPAAMLSTAEMVLV